MSGAKEEALSPDELRKRLYQTFKNRGVLDTLKTHLRNQLIQELKHPVLCGESVPRPAPGRSDSVLIMASNSLVADHLRNSGYEYTLSVFYPECGLGKDKVFTTKDLLQLMNVSPRSALFRSLASHTEKDNKGFLMSLLMELTDHHLHGEHCDAVTQTTNLPAYRESLVDKMKTIDEEYDALRHRGDMWVSYESKLAAYRKEIEAQVQAEMNAKLQHFKEVEIAKVKMEEKDKSRQEVLELRLKMERSYELKAEALINREKNAIDRLQKQQEMEEKDVYMQRQAVLKEIETVRNRETELKMRTEAFEKTCKIQEDKTRTMEDLLRRRELAVKTMEDTYDQKLKSELSRYQLELKEDYVKRTEKLTENENLNKAESARIQKECASLDARLEEHTAACSELRRLQADLNTAHSRASILDQQNQLLRERLEAVSDYPSLRRERAELQGQLTLVRTQLEEAQEENQLLQMELGRPSQEQLALQTELRRLEAARRLEAEDFENQRQVLQARLQSEVERCAQLSAQLSESEERTQRMTAHADDVKLQLRQTQQALENEVLRNPRPSLSDRSVLRLSADGLVTPDLYVGGGLLPEAHGAMCEAGTSPALGGRRARWERRAASPDSDAELVGGAMARIRELEREAEALEEAYQSYRRRAAPVSVSPPRPLSPQRAPFSHTGPLSPPRPHVPLRSRPHSPQRPPVSQRPPSPPRPLLPRQPAVTFSEDRWFPGDCGLLDPRFSAERDRREGRSPSPSRRLSSTPLPHPARRLQTATAEEASTGSPLPFPELSPDRQISPVPRGEAASSGGSVSDLSPPRSPQLRSTARDQISLPQVLQVLSSSEDSPQPEKITLEDLTQPLPEPGRIPELLLDTAAPLSEDAPDSPAAPPAPAPGDLPETRAEARGDVQQSPDEPVEEMTQEEEELRWEQERREREERRLREREEAREREVRELARLEQERFGGECGGEEKERGGEEEAREEKGGQEETKQKETQGRGEEASTDADPLQKYMRMVLEEREKQSHGREQSDQPSPEPESVSEEKADSIAAFSHGDDDDFW